MDSTNISLLMITLIIWCSLMVNINAQQQQAQSQPVSSQTQYHQNHPKIPAQVGQQHHQAQPHHHQVQYQHHQPHYSNMTSTMPNHQQYSGNNFLDDRNFRLNQDKREILQYLNTKNIVKTMLKLVFGTNEESMVTSRQVLNVFVKMLEVLKSSFGQRARSTSSTSRIRDTMDNAAQAGISMVQGYVKSVLAMDKNCIKRSICEGASNAARESRELGGLIAQIGGYATSYMLENQRSMPFGASFEAVRIGRSGADCRKAYKCQEEF